MEQEIIKFLYDNFDVGDEFNQKLNTLMNTDPFENKTKVEIRFYLRKMESDGLISTFKVMNDEFIQPKLKGFLEYERDINSSDKIFTMLLIKFIKFAKDIDDGKIKLNQGTGNQIGTYPYSKFLNRLKINKSQEKKMMFVRNESQKKYIRNGIGYAHKDLIFFGEEEPFLTYSGQIFLDRHHPFFKSHFITNLSLIRKEDDELRILVENNLWKDCCIKIGSILEYILTMWINSKGVPIKNLNTFQDKIDYYINTGASKYNQELGTITEWKVVKNVIKDYRNYVHLQKYEQRVNAYGYLGERDFSILFSGYRKLRELF